MTRIILALALLLAPSIAMAQATTTTIYAGQNMLFVRSDETTLTLPSAVVIVDGNRPPCIHVLNAGTGTTTILAAVDSPLYLPQIGEVEFQYRDGGWRLACLPERGVPTS